MNQELEPMLRRSPVIPVLTIETVEIALPLARALVKGGLPLLEITLRTQKALDVIEAVAAEVEHAVVGAGTVLNANQLDQATKRGAKFAVSPGVSDQLLSAAADNPVPLLPGTATASDVMRLLDSGYCFMKFFPAEPAGGRAYLKALSAPLQAAKFCPTGGIGIENAQDYLSLPNVICIGGSWVAPADAIQAADWPRIETLARQAASLESE
ncbi:MAG: bifunctional 4-hydroxy-2-oxoglutarate aldolase/2-dehydro-3-deoxy-phosphogluconate aldolase [Geminicoccaceae bacterium]